MSVVAFATFALFGSASSLARRKLAGRASWLGSSVVRIRDFQSRDAGFNSRPSHLVGLVASQKRAQLCGETPGAEIGGPS